MNPSVLACIALLAHIDWNKVSSDVVKTAADIAHGDGGVEKVRNSLGDFSKLLSDMVS